MQLSEQHRQKFRSLTPIEVGHLFTFGQQLQESCEKWLLAEDSDPRRIVERVVMEQFVIKLPEDTANWVLYKQPETLNEALQIAENHLTSLTPLQHLSNFDAYCMDFLHQIINELQQQKQHLQALMQAHAETMKMLQSFRVESKDAKKTIIQWSEQHRQKFRSLTLTEVGHLFTFGQQLQESCEKWLLAEDSDPRRIVERVVMEQFVIKLPEDTANWVQDNQPETLNEALQLADHHLASLTPLQHLSYWESYFTMDSMHFLVIIHQFHQQQQHPEALMHAQAETQKMVHNFM